MTAGFWSRADEERRALQAEFAAKATAQMLTAGAIDPTTLTPQARRTLAWLTGFDDPTIDGVADLLAAAHLSGCRAALAQPREDQASARPDELAVPATREADAPSRSQAGPSPSHLDDPRRPPVDRPASRPDTRNDREGDRTAGRLNAPSRSSVDRVADRLDALSRRVEDRVVEL